MTYIPSTMKNIALVPGILGFENIGHINYFNGIAPYLNAKFNGRVHVEPFDTLSLGTVEARAAILAKQITDRFHDEDVHIFAHSMGGLDARFLVAQRKTPVAKQIKSITAIGTPHQGSPIATRLNVLNPLEVVTSLTAHLGWANSFLSELKSKLNALPDLTEEVAEKFNKDNPDRPKEEVKYHEVVGLSRVDSPHTSAVFKLFYDWLDKQDIDSDGVVPVASATRPGRDPIARWPADHADMVGHDLDGGPTGTPKFFNYLAAYRELVERVVL